MTCIGCDKKPRVGDYVCFRYHIMCQRCNSKKIWHCYECDSQLYVLNLNSCQDPSDTTFWDKFEMGDAIPSPMEIRKREQTFFSKNVSIKIKSDSQAKNAIDKMKSVCRFFRVRDFTYFSSSWEKWNPIPNEANYYKKIHRIEVCRIFNLAEYTSKITREYFDKLVIRVPTLKFDNGKFYVTLDDLDKLECLFNQLIDDKWQIEVYCIKGFFNTFQTRFSWKDMEDFLIDKLQKIVHVSEYVISQCYLEWKYWKTLQGQEICTNLRNRMRLNLISSIQVKKMNKLC
jgi:hypothetical protein